MTRTRAAMLPVLTAMLAVAIASIGAQPARADEVAAFYKGKTLTILVGQEPGTGFDIYSRALARHYQRHIPGNPNIIVQNMPGASGVNAANYLNAIAPKDGTMIATFSQNVAVEPLMGNTAAKYDATKFVWIGNMEESAAFCAVTAASGVTKFDDLLSREIVFGATGPTGPLGQSARGLNSLLGAKLKIIYGYKGSASVKLAAQKGEVQGICGLPYSTLKAFWSDMLDAGSLKLIIQLSAKPLPEIKGVAHIDDYLKTDEQRQVSALIYGIQMLGRIYAAPPSAPVARTNALRTAFMATLRDAEFLAEAVKTKIDIMPATGQQVEAAIAGFYMSSPAIVEKTKQALKAD